MYLDLMKDVFSYRRLKLPEITLVWDVIVITTYFIFRCNQFKFFSVFNFGGSHYVHAIEEEGIDVVVTI
jgi:hypothetical protein